MDSLKESSDHPNMPDTVTTHRRAGANRLHAEKSVLGPDNSERQRSRKLWLRNTHQLKCSFQRAYERLDSRLQPDAWVLTAKTCYLFSSAGSQEVDAAQSIRLCSTIPTACELTLGC